MWGPPNDTLLVDGIQLGGLDLDLMFENDIYYSDINNYKILKYNILTGVSQEVLVSSDAPFGASDSLRSPQTPILTYNPALDSGVWISEIQEYSGMTVFPNPSANNFFFELEDSYQDIEVRVLSFTGSIVALEKFKSTNQFNLAFKAMPGKYLTLVYGDGKLINETILIKQ